MGQGDAYFGYGEYTKAAEMYRLALSKGGVDAATANLRLGASLMRGGDKAAAKAAFEAVQGGTRAPLAQYWLIALGKA
jgi:TolA-binding protein